MSNRYRVFIKRFAQIFTCLLLGIFLWVTLIECGSVENLFPKEGFPRLNIGVAGKITTSKISPNGSLRAILIDSCFLGLKPLDRNFDIVIQRKNENAFKKIFTSNDEGEPEGNDERDRFIWSKDSSRFLLVGEKFSSNYYFDRLSSETRRVQGGNLYLMYEISSGKIWLNGNRQFFPENKLPKFSLEDLKKYEWVSDF